VYVQHGNIVSTLRGCNDFVQVFIREAKTLWNWIRSTLSDLQQASRQLIGCGMLIRSTTWQRFATDHAKMTNATFGQNKQSHLEKCCHILLSQFNAITTNFISISQLFSNLTSRY